jgi:hypothetical protein
VSGLESGVVFAHPITITFQITQPYVTRTCAYFDFTSSSWKTDGCEIDATDVVLTQCKCVHLTNFAVLLDHQDASNQLSTANRLALGYLTTIGLSISIVLMALVVVVYTRYEACFSVVFIFH